MSKRGTSRKHVKFTNDADDQVSVEIELAETSSSDVASSTTSSQPSQCSSKARRAGKSSVSAAGSGTSANPLKSSTADSELDTVPSTESKVQFGVGEANEACVTQSNRLKSANASSASGSTVDASAERKLSTGLALSDIHLDTSPDEFTVRIHSSSASTSQASAEAGAEVTPSDKAEAEEDAEDQEIDEDAYRHLTEADMPRELRTHVQILKAVYFLLAFNSASWGRFGTIYYNEKGLSTTQIGLLEAIVPAIQVFAMPLWGILADKIRSRKLVSLCTSACSMSILVLLAFPQIAHDFHSILAITLSMACFSAGGVIDAHTLDVLGKKYKHLYGRIRLWAAVSWGCGALFMGLLNDKYGFTPNFIVYGILTLSSLCILIKVLPRQTKSEMAAKSSDVRFRDLGIALIRPRMLFFLFQMMIFGALMSVIERLLFLYIENELHGSTLLCGVTVAITILFELPVFYFAGPLTRKLGRHGMFAVAMVSQTVRLFGYTLLTESTRWWILAMETLHGITFACMWSVAVDYARAMLPMTWASTAQTILLVVLDCVGGGIGALVGGYVMHHHGGRVLYTYSGLIGTIGLAIHLAYMAKHGLGREAVEQVGRPAPDAPQNLASQDDEDLLHEARDSSLSSPVTCPPQ